MKLYLILLLFQKKCLDSLVAEDEACMTFTFTGLADETGLLLSFDKITELITTLRL